MKEHNSPEVLEKKAEKLLNMLRPPLPEQSPDGRDYPIGTLLTRISQQHEGGFQYSEMHENILPDLEKLVQKNKSEIIQTFTMIIRREAQKGLPNLSDQENGSTPRRFLKAWAYFFGAYYFETKHDQADQSAILQARKDFPQLFAVTDKLMQTLGNATKTLLAHEPKFTAFEPEKNRELTEYWSKSIKPLLREALRSPQTSDDSPSFLTIMTQAVSRELAGQPVGAEGRLWTALLAFFRKQGAKTYNDIHPKQVDFIESVLKQAQENNRQNKL